MKKFKKFFSVLFATIIVMSAFTVVPFTASAAVDNGECNVTASGDLGEENMSVNPPILSLVPLPTFTMDEVNISFDMMVK